MRVHDDYMYMNDPSCDVNLKVKQIVCNGIENVIEVFRL